MGQVPVQCPDLFLVGNCQSEDCFEQLFRASVGLLQYLMACNESTTLLCFCHAGTESWQQVVQAHDSSQPASEDHMAAMCQQSIGSAQAAGQIQPRVSDATTPQQLDDSGMLTGNNVCSTWLQTQVSRDRLLHNDDRQSFFDY